MTHGEATGGTDGAGAVVTPQDRSRAGAAWPRWIAGTGAGVLMAWLVSAVTFGILTFGGLFLGAFLAGRVAGAHGVIQWTLASLLTIAGFMLVYVQAVAVAV